jgi:HNH endonuclease
MRFDSTSTDTLEREAVDLMGLRSRIDGLLIEVLEELDSRQVATLDGCRSLSDWVSARLDVSSETAKSLVRTMRRTADRSDLRDALASGVSFDRIEALSRICEPVGLMEHVEVAAVHRDASLRARVTAADEVRTVSDRFLVMQPSLDESWWRVWGGLDGYAGSVVDKVLNEAADRLQDGDTSWRRATALLELCIADDPPPSHVTILVDAKHAVEANGEAGVILESGPRVGARALEAVLCDAVTEVTVRASDGRYMEYGRRHRVVPPTLRRALIDKYRGVCAVDGCQSRSRLQAHHIIPWTQGGRTDQENLVLLCWFHHHVAIHERGFEIYRHPSHGRIRLRNPRLSHGP